MTDILQIKTQDLNLWETVRNQIQRRFESLLRHYPRMQRCQLNLQKISRNARTGNTMQAKLEIVRPRGASIRIRKLGPSVDAVVRRSFDAVERRLERGPARIKIRCARSRNV